MHRYKTVLLIILNLVITNLLVWNSSECIKKNIYITKCIKKERLMHRTAHFFGEIIVDALMLNINVFSIDSVKVITAFTPAYLISRMFDERVQENFHDRMQHKNIYQLPKKYH